MTTPDPKKLCDCPYFEWCGEEDYPDSCACGHSVEEHPSGPCDYGQTYDECAPGEDGV